MIEMELQKLNERLDTIINILKQNREQPSPLVRGKGMPEASDVSEVSSKFYFTDDISKIMGRTEATVRRWCRLQRIPCHLFEGKYRFDKAVKVEKFLSMTP